VPSTQPGSRATTTACPCLLTRWNPRLIALDPRSAAGQRRYKPLWSTSSAEQLLSTPEDPAGTGVRDKQVQATNTANIIRELAHTPYIAAAVLYKLQAPSRRIRRTVRQRHAQAGVHSALPSVAFSPLAGVSPSTLKPAQTRRPVLARGRGPVGLYGLEAFPGSQLRYRALFTQPASTATRSALPSVLGTRRSAGACLSVLGGPGRAPRRASDHSASRSQRLKVSARIPGRAERPVATVVSCPTRRARRARFGRAGAAPGSNR